MIAHAPIRLADFQISPRTGFLPEQPVEEPLHANHAWYHLADNLPKLLPTGTIRQRIEALPAFVADTSHLEQTMRMLSYLGHAYLWGDKTYVPDRLPHNLSDAWVHVANQVGRPPILSYPSYCLYNYRLINPAQPPYLENVQIIQNFLGGVDEDWFILIHVDIEARAAQAIRAVPGLLEAAAQHHQQDIQSGLGEVLESLRQMNATMNRMPENCDPYIYYSRVRPYIFGTKNNPALPQGLIYEGHYDNHPQLFRGETGAQSAIVPTLDGLLGVSHQDDPLKEYLLEMRDYMVPAHRRFVEFVERNAQIRAVAKASTDMALKMVYNQCIEELFRFRAKHLEYAASYIHKQALQANNSNVVGTGGTPFMEYLAKHRDETKLAVM
ncbi:hypothetical protein GCM10023189_25120 [Nibrella saemangeumensis]|uniref:Indoleamine 2,3-dioxygenase n=1 Tax=Nibrella saemangeumensis TaxID=1084526 RepID=A0ABP8MXV2_9BACT